MTTPAPVRRQMLAIQRAVNRARQAAGLGPVPSGCFRFKRRIYRPFEAPFTEEGEVA